MMGPVFGIVVCGIAIVILAGIVGYYAQQLNHMRRVVNEILVLDRAKDSIILGVSHSLKALASGQVDPLIAKVELDQLHRRWAELADDLRHAAIKL